MMRITQCRHELHVECLTVIKFRHRSTYASLVLSMISTLSIIFAFLTLMVLFTKLTVQNQDIVPTATSMALFQAYFNETFIRKIKASWDPKLKAYTSRGYS